jgi:hypothetical protein
MSYFHILMKFAAAAAVAFAIGAAGAPANAALTLNALTLNALTLNALSAQGSTLDDLNGVAVEAVTSPEENACSSLFRRQDGTLAPGALVAFDPKPEPPGFEDW